ncbi:hypothetical protein MJT46_012523 [Ovis ammon polii x Ovis aries]|nr:hypothetical protein MJT46_012523 [Ovis ammon polii x Ovis aries]
MRGLLQSRVYERANVQKRTKLTDPQKMFALGSLSFGGVPSVHRHLASSSFIQYVVWTQDSDLAMASGQLSEVSDFWINLSPNDLNLSFSGESRAAGVIGPLTYEERSHWKDNLWKLFLVAIADLGVCRARSVGFALAEHNDSTLLCRRMSASHQFVNVCHYVGI